MGVNKILAHWYYVAEKRHILMVATIDKLFFAEGEKKPIQQARDQLETAADPRAALPDDTITIPLQHIQEIRRQHNESFVELSYGTSVADAQTVMIDTMNKKEAAVLCKELAELAEMESPRQEPASVWDIASGPAIFGGMLLLMLGGMFFVADEADSGPRRFGKAGTIKRIASALGEEGILIVMAVVFTGCLGFFLFRFFYRPLVDVYEPTKQ